MKKCFFFLAFLFVLFQAFVIAFAQQDEKVLLWSARSQSITNDILKEIDSSSSSEKPLRYGLLGEAWWEKDSAKGKFWLDKAVEYAVSPATEYTDKKEKLQVVRDLLKIVASKDAVLEKKLVTVLSETSEDLSDKDAEENSEAILQTAISLVDVDVQRAFNLGVFTLRQKTPVFSFTSMRLFLKMQKRNETLANNYYALALGVAKTNETSDFFDNLIRLSFPEPTDSEHAFVSDNRLRRSLLETLSDRIEIEAEEVLEKRRNDCNLTGYYGRRLLSNYEALVPERLQIIIQAINTCQISLKKDEKSSSPFDEKPKTIDEFLSAAEKTDDKSKKAEYLIEAARLAERQKQYKRAIQILYTVDGDMRNKPFGVWEATLLFAATPLIIEFIENDNLPEMYGIFKKLPDVTRTLVRISVIDKLDEKKYRFLGYELLGEARKELGRIDFKPVGKDVRVLLANPTMFEDVVYFYNKFGYQTEAIETYDESIKALNRFTAQIASEEKHQRNDSQPIKWTDYADFNGSFYETYFQRIDQNISQIEYKTVRLAVRIHWLKLALKKQSDVEKEAQKIRPKSVNKLGSKDH
ncbi:MAG: hypothetical protein ACKVQJ_10610 [Pyrinomonadaceae bacterium]